MFEQLVRQKRVLSFGLIAILGLAGCSTLQPGPLEVPPDHGYGGLVVDTGTTFSDGFETFFVRSDEPVTITKIELIDTPDQLRLVDAVIAGEEREGNFQFEPVYPPVENKMGPLVPAVGATLLPIDQQDPDMFGYTLIMAIEVTEPGRWVRGGYRVEYQVDGVTYGWDARAEITICTPDYVDSDGECLMDDSGE